MTMERAHISCLPSLPAHTFHLLIHQPFLFAYLFTLFFLHVEPHSYCSVPYIGPLNVTRRVNVLDMRQNDYSPDMACEWLFQSSDPNYVIKVKVTDLDTECSWDQLYLYDGNSFTSRLLGVYSGAFSPRVVYAYSGYLMAFFFSDIDGVFPGFRLEYSLVTKSEITSPDQCDESLQCAYPAVCDPSSKKCICDSGKTGAFCTLSKMFDDNSVIRDDRPWHLVTYGSTMSRSGHRLVYCNCDFAERDVWMFGGYDLNNTLSGLYRSHDFITFNLVNVSSPAAPAARYHHRMVAQVADLPLYSSPGVPSDELYGEDAFFLHGGTMSDDHLSSELWKYRIAQNEWVQLPSSPLAVADHVMVMVDNRWLYIHGGRSSNSSNNPIGSMYSYDTKEQIWTEVLSTGGWQSNLRLAGHSAIYDPEGVIYIYGGLTPSNARFQEANDTLWAFNLKERFWYPVMPRGPKPPALAFHDAVLVGDQIIIYGGKKDKLCFYQEVAIFNIKCQMWNIIPADAFNTSQLTRDLGQTGHSMLVAESAVLFVYGGLQGSLTSDIIAIRLKDLLRDSISCVPEYNRCESQTTCGGCVLQPDMACSWCPKERRCINANLRCRMDINWGNNSQITSQTQCQAMDVPAGWWTSIYKYPANYSQPDEVYLVSSMYIRWSLRIEDFFCPTCYSHMISRGNIVGLVKQNRILQLVSVRNNASVVRITPGQPEMSLAYLERSPSQRSVNVSGDIEFIQGHLELRGSYPADPNLSYDCLVAFNPVPGFRYSTQQELPLQYLQPVIGLNCSAYSSCLPCVADSSCGWCTGASSCLFRNESCVGINSTFFLITSPSLCRSCYSLTDCTTCTQVTDCEWHMGKPMCSRRGRYPGALQEPARCPPKCHTRTTCTDCLYYKDECAWCFSLSVCLPFDDYQLRFSHGECLGYEIFNPNYNNQNCIPCSAYTTCEDCQLAPMCGWCSHDNDPSIGKCVSGDFSQPKGSVLCSDVMKSILNETSPATWSYGSCPDLLECKLGTHNCVSNAICTDTLSSFECTCTRGYQGVGNKTCSKTCFYECVNGVCAKANATEFACSCHLGWTGDSCDKDCGCHYHSSCTRGIGSCDLCEQYTQGRHCELCIPRSYGNATSPDGCKPCDCNGHGNLTLDECDIHTGKCHCVDNTIGDHCTQCAPGYVGDPRQGGTCFQCYSGRTAIHNFTVYATFGTQTCTRSLASNTTTFMWVFYALPHRSTNFPPLYLLPMHVGAGIKQLPVYIYNTLPTEILPSAGNQLAMSGSYGATLTATCNNSGPVVSRSGILSVVYFNGGGEGSDYMFNFKLWALSCPDNCPSELHRECNPLGDCVCQHGRVGEACDMKLCSPACDVDCRRQTGCVLPTEFLPREFYALAACSPNSYFIHGGRLASGQLAGDLWTLNFETLMLTQILSHEPGPSPRHLHSAACIDGALYILGGVSSPSNSLDALGDFWLFQNGAWEELNSAEQSFISELELPSLVGHALTVVGSSLYVIGGFSPPESWNNKVLQFSSGIWKRLATSGIGPLAVAFHSTTYHTESNAIFVVGGNTVPNGQPLMGATGWASEFMFVLDLSSLRWRTLTPTKTNDQFSPRFAHSVYSRYDWLYVAGGFHGTTSLLPPRAGTPSSVQAYSYKCNQWFTLSLQVPSFNAGRIVLPITGGVVIVGGTVGSSASHMYALLEVCSQLNSTECVLREGCSLCETSVSSSKSALCVPLDAASSARVTCDAYEACTPHPPEKCGSATTCLQCTSEAPWLTQGCSWCTTLGACVEEGTICRKPVMLCPETSCRALTCSDCPSTTSSCIWHQLTNALSQSSWKCDTPLSSAVIPATSLNVTNQIECPSPCREEQTCTSCLTKQSFPHTAAACVWSTLNQRCVSVEEVSILCVDGACGPMLSNSSSCSSDCLPFTACATCLSQPSCGWCSVNGSDAGVGMCLPGNLHASANCSVNLMSRMGLLSTTLTDQVSLAWNFVSCPPENECLTPAHHNCDPKVEQCKDLPVGFACPCRDGYASVTSLNALYNKSCPSYRAPDDEPICVPQCSTDCGEHGCCADTNTCNCTLGYVGAVCNKRCDCNLHSTCPEDNLTMCDSCQHNTTGVKCQFCLPKFVGNPINGSGCMSCNELCHHKASWCTDDHDLRWPTQLEQLGRGPLLPERTVCLNCTQPSEGNHCESCPSGYFLLNQSCTACMCNGHSQRDCQPSDGTGCECKNNTVSSSKLRYDSQCDACGTDYQGFPVDSHQCYSVVTVNQKVCLDRSSRSECQALLRGQTVFYVINPVDGRSITTDIDIRFYVDIIAGEVDIYVAHTPSTFIVAYDPEIDEHVISIDSSSDALVDMTYPPKRRARSVTTVSDSAGYNTSIEQLVHDGKDHDAVYITLNTKKRSVVRLTNISNRAVIIFSSLAFNYQSERFYIIVKSLSTEATGSVYFTQYPTSLNLLVFFSIFFAGAFMILCAVVIIWKIHQLHMFRQLQVMRQEELHTMAERPFACKMVYLAADPVMATHEEGQSGSAGFRLIPVAVEPTANGASAVVTVFIVLPGDESRPLKASLASCLMSWKETTHSTQRARESKGGNSSVQETSV